MKFLLSIIFAGFSVCRIHAAVPLKHSDKVGDFVLGCEAYTFNQFTALEAIEKTKAAGGKTIEFFSWEKFSTNYPKLDVNYTLPQKPIDELKAALNAAGIRATSLYIGNAAFSAKDAEAALRKNFELAKKLDLIGITGEPPESGFDLMEKLCKEYKIQFNLHNHRREENKPEYKYWDPAHNAALMKGRSEWMGFCLDTGHLVRSGLKVADALELYKGRLHTLHLKDPIDPNGHDTVFGQGCGDVAGVLKTLKKQHFKGYISIEYESDHQATVLPEIKGCVDFVRNQGGKTQ